MLTNLQHSFEHRLRTSQKVILYYRLMCTEEKGIYGL